MTVPHTPLMMTRHNQSRNVGLAFAASLIIHAGVYLATPRWANEFNAAKTVRYDASLVPAAAAVVNAPPPTQAAKPRAKLAPLATKPSIKSAANFAAPENAIAVIATNETSALDATPENTLTEPAAAEALAQTPPQINVNAPALEPLVSTIVEPKSTPKRVAPAFAERISIEYKLTSAITDGVANFKWTRMGTRYEIESSTEATGFLVSAFAGLIYQQSVGEITDDGLRPLSFSIRRGEGVTETAEFQRDTNSLQFKGRRESRVVPLPRDMQDMQSFLFQLAFDAPRLAETGGNVDVLVTNARKVYRYQFKKMGSETLDTRMGKIDTIRLLSDAPNPEDAYEVWLAPQYFYLPVKIKLYLGKFPVEQVVTRIGMSAKPENSDK
jgi:hypothetical protein